MSELAKGFLRDLSRLLPQPRHGAAPVAQYLPDVASWGVDFRPGLANDVAKEIGGVYPTLVELREAMQACSRGQDRPTPQQLDAGNIRVDMALQWYAGKVGSREWPAPRRIGFLRAICSDALRAAKARWPADFVQVDRMVATDRYYPEAAAIYEPPLRPKADALGGSRPPEATPLRAVPLPALLPLPAAAASAAPEPFPM